MPRQSKYSEEQQKQMIELYKNGLSSIQISEIFNGSPSGIAYLIKKQIGELRSNKENSRVYTYDINYFQNIDSTEKAYWLGFIYADGYVKKNGKGKMFGLTLSIEDKEHLEKFSTALNYNYPIKTYNPTKGAYSSKKYCRIQIFGDEIYNSLVKHGVLENKTLILKPPNINKKFYRYFIRGYYDGDGCITYNSKDHKTFKIKILGTKEILKFIIDYIESNDIASITKFYKRRNTDKVLSIEMGGNYQVYKFLELTYEDSFVCLKRKHMKYLELCNILHSRL